MENAGEPARRWPRILVPLAMVMALGALHAFAAEPPLSRIQLPPGFQIAVFAEVPSARSMAVGPRGTVFVGTRTDGRVFALVDGDGDHRAERVHVLASGLYMPAGVAFRDGSLYVAEIDRILRFDDIEDRLAAPPQPVVVTDRLPRIEHLGWKFIAFGPDGWLYLPVGAPCDVCDSKDPLWASLARLRPDGTGLEPYALGVRHGMGFDWHPGTGQLFFVDNGRNGLGQDLPPDELNVATAPRQHFGFPYCFGSRVADPVFGGLRPCSDLVPPAIELDAHVVPLGLRFYTGRQFPAEYRDQVFIAEHGSRTTEKQVGCRLTLVRLQQGRPVSREAFAQGWLQDGKCWGRPADVLVMPDGALLVSDDEADLIYRISYGAPSPS